MCLCLVIYVVSLTTLALLANLSRVTHHSDYTHRTDRSLCEDVDSDRQDPSLLRRHGSQGLK